MHKMYTHFLQQLPQTHVWISLEWISQYTVVDDPEVTQQGVFSRQASRNFVLELSIHAILIESIEPTDGGG